MIKYQMKNQYATKGYKVNALPQLLSNKFFVNAQYGFTGSKISRKVKGSLGLYTHVGLIYGTIDQDVLIVIENNTEGVVCISFEEFTQGFDYKIEYNLNPFMFDLIMKRVKERANMKYHARFNNCDHFVNYCLTGQHKSFQAENTEMLVNAAMSCCEWYLVMGQVHPKLIENYSKLRKLMRLQRPEGMDELINQYSKTFIDKPISANKSA